jgi:tetratricopeptide (TPR) repeat protein
VVKLPHPDECPTAPGSIIGTPHFMAPEQARGEPVDARADVYSLGSVLFKLVTGRFVYEADHIIAYLARLVLEEPPLASSVRFDVPEALDALLLRLLSRNPAERPSDAGELARWLARVTGLNNQPPGSDASASAMRRVAQAAEPPSRPEPKRRDALAGPTYSTRPPAPPGSLERRVVAVVLASVPPAGVGAEADAHVRRMLGEDARVQLLAGDQLVAAAGVGRTTGDEAVRAARAALLIATTVPDARVAVATGHAVAGRRGLTGEALERAAAQLERAPSGGVRLDKATYPLLEGRFVVRLDDVGATLLHEDTAGVGVRRLLGKTTPTVGRDREIALLCETFRATMADARPRALLVTGPMGVGKSRVRQAAVRQLRQEYPVIDVVVVRGDPMLSHMGLSAMGRALRLRMGVRDGEPVAQQAERVFRYAEQRPGCPPWTVEFLGELVGVPFNDQGSEPLRAAREAPQLMTMRILRALEAIVRHDARSAPQLLLLEDLHSLDESTVEICEWLLGCADMRFAIFAFGRPELAARFPELWPARELQRVELGPLAPAACQELVSVVLPDLDAGRRSRLVERADGNVLFLEELMRHAAEGRDDLPLSVQALIQTRLDTLPPEMRRVARAASVFGRQCWTGGVSALVGRDCSADLEALAQAEILARQESSRILGETEWTYQHNLVYETAYSSLLPEDRISMHRAAGEWLLQAGEEDTGAIAKHAESGGDRARAALLYVRAAGQAYANGQLIAALDFADRGIGSADEPNARAQLMLQRAQVLTWLGRYDEQLEAAESACSFAAAGTDLWGEAQRLAGVALRELGRPADAEKRLLWTLESPTSAALSASTRSRLHAERTRALVDMGRPRDAQTVAEMAVQIAREAGDAGTNAMLRALDARFMAIAFLGDFSASIEAASAVAERADAAGDSVLATRARINLGFVLNRVGRFEEAREALDRALEDTRMLRMKAGEGFALHNIGMSLGRLDDLDAGIEHEREAIAIGEQTGHYRLKLSGRIYLAELLTWRGAPGDLGAAHAVVQDALREAAVHPISHIEALAVLAQVQLARRAVDSALAACEEALERLGAVGSIEEGEEWLRLVYVEALLSAGRGEEADKALRAAHACVMGRCAQLGRQEHRDAFLSRLYECRRIVDLAVERLGLPPPAIASAPPPPVVPRYSAPPGPLRTAGGRGGGSA